MIALYTLLIPFQMLVLNNLSRYYVAKFAILAGRKNPEVDSVADRLVQEIDKKVDDFWVYINDNGKGESERREPRLC
jgi:phosphoketolase